MIATFPPSRSLENWAAGRGDELTDGELDSDREPRKDRFQALQNFLRDPSVAYRHVAFDLLAFGETICATKPLAERKELLESLMSDAPTTSLQRARAQ